MGMANKAWSYRWIWISSRGIPETSTCNLEEENLQDPRNNMEIIRKIKYRVAGMCFIKL